MNALPLPIWEVGTDHPPEIGERHNEDIALIKDNLRATTVSQSGQPGANNRRSESAVGESGFTECDRPKIS